MIISGANNLKNNKTEVDTLNVFPVPDGDTGTNMSLTFSAAADEIKKFQTTDIGAVAKTLSGASLRGARGNSGVILSQLCRGIFKALDKCQEADAKKIAEAIQSGVDTAYKAVMRPTEGTILTVARESAAEMVKKAETTEDIEEIFKTLVDAALVSLNNTPNLLPVLKEAGVVDAGGAGLVKIYEGFLAAVLGNEIELLSSDASKPEISVPANQAEIDTANIKFAYCTEFIIDKSAPDVNVSRFSEVIDDKGDCKLVIDDDDIVKVHIHTNHPGFVLEEALKLGMLSKIKIDNMKMQHSTIIENASEAPKEEPKKPHKKYGFVSVTAGEGLSSIFKDYGVDEIIEGGQTMNPSTDDILSAIEKINADYIFVLPNNKNIILAAEQAKELAETEVIVIPSKSFPQGVSAMMAFLPHMEAEANTEAMLEAIKNVKTGQVTFAVRDTSVNGKEIKSGDIIGISEGEISSVGKTPEEVCSEIIENLSDEDTEVVTLYYGEDVSEEKAEELLETLEEKYDEIDILLQAGKQPLYYYIVSVE